MDLQSLKVETSRRHNKDGDVHICIWCHMGCTLLFDKIVKIAIHASLREVFERSIHASLREVFERSREGVKDLL